MSKNVLPFLLAFDGIIEHFCNLINIQNLAHPTKDFFYLKVSAGSIVFFNNLQIVN